MTGEDRGSAEELPRLTLERAANGNAWGATPRRFAMVSTFYPPYSFGGDATYLYRLANALANDGHLVDVVHCLDSYQLLAERKPPSGYPNHQNVRVHTLKSRLGPLSPLLTQQTGMPWLKSRTLHAVLEDLKPDVIHFHNVSLVGGPGVLTFGNAIKLYTTHEHWLVCPMHVLWKFGREVCEKPSCFSCQIRGGRPPQLWRATGLMERSLDAIDMFLAPSRFTMHMHQQRGLAGRPFVYLPYFLPEPERQPEPAIRERPYFLFVGRLERIKGADRLVSAFRRFRDADLVIAGDGADSHRLRGLASDLGHVHFLGRQGQADLARLYRGAVAVVVPSLCYEVFGIVIIEGFSVGTPAIVNDLGALPEVIADSDGGAIYQTEDELIRCLRRMLDNSEERDRLGQNGRNAFAERWSAPAHLSRYYDIIGEIDTRRRTALAAT